MRVQSHRAARARPGRSQVEDQEIFRSCRCCRATSASAAGYCRLRADPQSRRGARAAAGSDLGCASGSATGYVNSNSDGDDGAPLTDYDLIGSEVERTGLFALESCDYFNFCACRRSSRDQDVGPERAVGGGALLQGARRACSSSIRPRAGTRRTTRLRACANWDIKSAKTRSCISRASWRTTSCAAISNRLRPAARSPACWRGAMTAHPVWGEPRNDEAVLRPGYRPVCLVPEDRRMRLAAARRQHAAGRALRRPHRRQAAHPGGGRGGHRGLAESRRAAPGAVHRQQHRARHALGRRSRALDRDRADNRRARARVFRAAARGRRLRRAAPRGVAISCCAIAASTRRTSAAANFNS